MKHGFSRITLFGTAKEGWRHAGIRRKRIPSALCAKRWVIRTTIMKSEAISTRFFNHGEHGDTEYEDPALRSATQGAKQRNSQNSKSKFAQIQSEHFRIVFWRGL